MNKIQRIVQAMILNKGVVIDDHTGRETTFEEFATFVSNNGTEHVVGVCGGYFSINPLDIIDDKVHLTTYALGGVVQGVLGDLVFSLTKYNEENTKTRFNEHYELKEDGSATLTILPKES